MARNRKATRRRLTFDQETVLSSWGNLLSGEPGESNLDTACRLFGSVEAARAGWYGHRDAFLAADPVAGRRPCGWWLFERGRDMPPVESEPALLRELGELTRDEQSQLEEWRRMRPEPPTDLAVDLSAIDPINIVEEPHGDEPIQQQADAGTGTPEVPGRLGEASAKDSGAPEPPGDAGAPDVAPDPPEQSTAAPEPIVTPQIIPWPQQPRRRPPEIEGWDTHDA